MLSVAGVWKHFNGTAVVADVTFGLQDGQVVGLVGPSGSGKSVLLKLLGEVIAPDQGRIAIVDQSGQEQSFSVGFLFQEGALFDSMSVIDNVAFPLLSPRNAESAVPACSFDEAMERSYEILQEVGLAEAYLKMPGQLSGGMRRRVALARALVAHPDLVLLDDPTGGLDPVSASVIMNLIRTLHEHYRPTIVMVSHDIRRLLPSVERVLALFAGRIVADAAVTELIERAPGEVVKFLATRYDFGSRSEPAPSCP